MFLCMISAYMKGIGVRGVQHPHNSHCGQSVLIFDANALFFYY